MANAVARLGIARLLIVGSVFFVGWLVHAYDAPALPLSGGYAVGGLMGWETQKQRSIGSYNRGSDPRKVQSIE